MGGAADGSSVTLHPSLHPDGVQVLLWCKDEAKGGGTVCNNIVFNAYKGSKYSGYSSTLILKLTNVRKAILII